MGRGALAVGSTASVTSHENSADSREVSRAEFVGLDAKMGSVDKAAASLEFVVRAAWNDSIWASW